MKKIVLLGLFSAALGFTSCSSDSNGDNSQTATVNVKLTDGPALYDAVKLDVQRVEINANGNWHAINFPNPGIYNLLDFKNGMDVALGQAILPVGQVTQMRMVLGPSNTIIVDGVSHPLDTPSAQQSGLKFNWNQTLAPNGAYNVWIDFDAGKSIVKTGNGSYKLKPVIRAFSELTDGQIKGYVLPPLAKSMVHVINVNDTVASALPNPDGFFMFRGIPQGNYRVSYDALNSTGYIDEEQPNVSVTFGQVTDLGIKTLHQ